MRRTKVVILLLTIAAATPVAAVATWSIHQTLNELSDPCAKWGNMPGEPEGQITASIGPHDPCRAVSVHSGSKARAAIIAALVPGGLLTAALLAVGGAAFSRRRVMFAGAIGMLAETTVVFTIAPLTALVGLSFLFLAGRVQPNSRV